MKESDMRMLSGKDRKRALATARKQVKRKAMRQFRKGAKCPYCGKVMVNRDIPNHPAKPSVDHLVPFGRGGSYRDEKNIILCCSECNWKKGNMTPFEFIFNLGPRG